MFTLLLVLEGEIVRYRSNPRKNEWRARKKKAKIEFFTRAILGRPGESPG